MLVGLLEAELLGCCEDMALKISTEEDDVPSEGYQSASDREKRILALGFLFRSFISSGMYRKNIELEKQVQRTELFNDGNYTQKKKKKRASIKRLPSICCFAIVPTKYDSMFIFCDEIKLYTIRFTRFLREIPCPKR